MSKEKAKISMKSVGVGVPDDPHHRGITLIALIITIIIMLILIGVSVTIALNGGLFRTAKDAANQTETKRDEELSQRIKIGDTWYDSIEAYRQNIPSENQEDTLGGNGGAGGNQASYITSIEGLAEGVTLIAYEDLETVAGADIKAAVDAGKVSAVLKETITLGGAQVEAKAVIPTGYKVSTVDGEDSISNGLVIYDGTSENDRNNEFVWIPVGANFDPTYTTSSYAEPKYLKTNDSNASSPYDSQTTIDYYYGKNADAASYYTIDINSADATTAIATNTTEQNGTTFDYGYHYNEMVTSVNKYNGFYIGRYETTKDADNKIGSKQGATVVSADLSLSQTNNKAARWWGLYAIQRNSDIQGNGSNVQTNMIWGKQWDVMITFFGNKDYSSTTVSTLSTSRKTSSRSSRIQIYTRRRRGNNNK